MMKVSIEKGMAIFDICDLFDGCDPDELNKIVQSLSCQDAILRHVTDQLLEGWTEDGYHGSKGGDSEESHSPIDVARRRIALGAGEVAKETIEAQQRTIARQNEYASELWQRIHKLERVEA